MYKTEFQTPEDVVRECKNKGVASWGDYYIECENTLFQKSAELYKYAHPDSMSQNHCVKVGPVEELAWDLFRYCDPIETCWGNF